MRRGRGWDLAVAAGAWNAGAGVDALRRAEGGFVRVYTPGTRGGRHLASAVSDDGVIWRSGVTLEQADEGEFSYPAMIQTSDGLVHVTYTWRRQRVKHVVLDPARLE